MMPKHIAVTLDQVMQAVEADEYLGFCVTCGTEHMNVEPDAREYPCEECGESFDCDRIVTVNYTPTKAKP